MKTIIIIATLTIQFAGFGQADSAKTIHKKYKTLYFYTHGLPSYWGAEKQCSINLRKQYGFDYMRKAGCIVKQGKVRRWERHNKELKENWQKDTVRTGVKNMMSSLKGVIPK